MIEPKAILEHERPASFSGLNTSGIAAALYLALLAAGCSPSVSDSLQQGKSFAAKGDLATAVISFKNAVQKEANSLPARLALAEALENSDDAAGAEQQYRQALALGGDANELVPKIAVLLLDRGEPALLVKDFAERKLTAVAADSDLRGTLALAHLALGQKNAAIAQLEQAKTKTAAVHLAQAQNALAGKRRQEALAEVDAALKPSQVPWWVWRGAGRVYASNGDKTNALAALQHTYELAPWHHGVIAEYAEWLIGSGHGNEARPLRDKLNKIAPAYYRTLHINALFLMNEGKYEEAWSLATKVLGTLPEHIPSQLIAATVELTRGELASADARVTRILNVDPNSSRGLRLRTFLELQRGNAKAAEVSLGQALRLAPKDKELLALSAELGWAHGERANALKQFEAAALSPPAQAQLLARLGEMRLALGKRSEAIAAVDAAIELSKTDGKQRNEVFRTIFRMHLLDKAKGMAQGEMERHPKDPEPVLWLAAVLGSEGNEAAAREQTRHALDVRADYYPALAALAIGEKTPERGKEYDSRLQKAIDSGSKDARVYFERARRFRLTGADPERVSEVLDKGVAADPTSIQLRDAAVRYWLARGHKEKALALAREGEAAQPDNTAMLALAGSAYYAAGDLQQATQKYAKLSTRFQSRVDWNLTHAQILNRSGKPTEAIASLIKLINLRPDEPAPYQALAMLQMDQGKAADAQLTATMLRDRPSFRVAGWLLLGDVLGRTERKPDGALKAYAEAGKAGAAEAAVLRKVDLLDRTGARELANGELRDWLSAHPNSVAALFLAARRETGRQDFVAAARYFDAIVKRDPKNFVALNELAWVYAKAHNPASLATARTAAELAPENPTVLDTLAEAQNEAGQKNDAVTTLRRAVSIDPGAAVARIHLAELLGEGGKKKEASEMLANIEERTLDNEGKQRFKVLKARL